MRPLSTVLVALSLSAVSLSANADDPPARLPSIPTLTPDVAPSYTYPAPMGSSAGNGVIPSDPMPPMTPGTPLVTQGPPPMTGTIVRQWSGRSNSSTIDQFQSSNYWSAPRTFTPTAAHNYGNGLAEGWGTHIRFPYFKHRAPWTYQGPAAISHTIYW